MASDDKAPVVYDADGNPMRVRVTGGECEGDVSGEGHYGYRPTSRDLTAPATVYFEAVDDGE